VRNNFIKKISVSNKESQIKDQIFRLIFFSVIIDEIIKEFKSASEGYRNGRNKEMKIVCYADDAIIISEDENNLQRSLHKFVLKKYNMSIYLQKIVICSCQAIEALQTGGI